MLIGFSIARHENAFRMTKKKGPGYLYFQGVFEYALNIPITAVEQCCSHSEMIANCYGHKAGMLLGTLYVSIPK